MTINDEDKNKKPKRKRKRKLSAKAKQARAERIAAARAAASQRNAASVSVKRSGKGLAAALGGMLGEAQKALERGAFEIFNASQERAPVDTGALRASGSVTTGAKDIGGTDTYLIAYGVDYALPVHQRHPTKSNYLLGPFRELQSKIKADIRAAMRKGIRR